MIVMIFKILSATTFSILQHCTTDKNCTKNYW